MLTVEPSDGMKILHVIAPAPFGGLERVVHALCSGLAGRGHEVHVAALLDLGTRVPAIVRDLETEGVALQCLYFPHRAYVAEWRRLRRFSAELRPHLVHTHGYHTDIIAGAAARRAGIPTATTVHGFIDGDRRNRLYQWLQRRAFRRFDAVVCVSRPLHEHVRERGVRADRAFLVPNAWHSRNGFEAPAPARAALDSPPGRFHVGWVGRLGREKGPDVLLDALPHLADLDLHVSVIGGGREEPELRARATRLGVARRVGWCGVLHDAARLFPAFDAFVLSSRTEGMPIVLLEAMAAGVPVVATRVGGVPDAVSDAEALIVPPEDPVALAAAIRRIHDRPDEARTRAAAARGRIESNFGLEPWLDAYESIYRLVARVGASEVVPTP